MNERQRSGMQARATGVRTLAALAVLAVAGTYLAAQIDQMRRHHAGISPERYLLPQLTHIWLPGLGVAAALCIIALWLRRRRAPDDLPSADQSVASGPDHD